VNEVDMLNHVAYVLVVCIKAKFAHVIFRSMCFNRGWNLLMF